MFQELFPILTTGDLPRALGFYRDLLGFEVSYRFPPGPNRLLRLLCLPCFSLHELFANAKDTYVESLWIQFCFAI